MLTGALTPSEGVAVHLGGLTTQSCLSLGPNIPGCQQRQLTVVTVGTCLSLPTDVTLLSVENRVPTFNKR